MGVPARAFPNEPAATRHHTGLWSETGQAQAAWTLSSARRLMNDTNKLAQYVANWQDERNGAALYRAISELEKNPQLKKVYQRLGEAEERHSCFWEAKLRAAR